MSSCINSITILQAGLSDTARSREQTEERLRDEQALSRMDNEGCPNDRQQPEAPQHSVCTTKIADVACSSHQEENRAPILGLRTMQTAQLERILEYTVIQSWDELMPDPKSGLIHIEYQTGSDSSLDFLKVWASTIRGHWNLVSEFWMRPLWSHATGLRFGASYHSIDFARTLNLVMAHANGFANLPDQHGLIQVSPPTSEERREAESWKAAVFQYLDTMSLEQHVAA